MEKRGICCRCRSDVLEKVLYRGSVPELLLLYHRSPNVYFTPSPVWGGQTSVVASGGSWGSVAWAKRQCGNATVYFMNKFHQISLNGNSWQAYDGAYKLPDGINIATDSTSIWFQAMAKVDDAACKIDVYCQGNNINATAINQYTSTVNSNARIACQLWVFDD